MGFDSLKLISEIGRKCVDSTGERRSFEFLKQRISVEIQRGNAFSVFGTLPNVSELVF